MPNKNIKLLGGRPLISYVLSLANSCNLIDKVIVSTDSSKIRGVVEKMGFCAPFLRPSSLATDSARTIDVLVHALKEFEKIQKCRYEIIILLQPTTPFTSKHSLQNAIKKIKKSRYNSIISLVDAGLRGPSFIYKVNRNKATCLDRKTYTSRHSLPRYYLQTGNIYICRRKLLINKQIIIDKKNTGFVVIPEHENWNIDTLRDWEIAKSILKENKKNA